MNLTIHVKDEIYQRAVEIAAARLMHAFPPGYRTRAIHFEEGSTYYAGDPQSRIRYVDKP